jgi:hypothetical protein
MIRASAGRLLARRGPRSRSERGCALGVPLLPSPVVTSRRLAVLATLALSPACVPEGPATVEAGTSTPARPSAPAAIRPKGDAGSATAGRVITTVYEDGFDRPELGPDYNVLSPKWKIENGRLCGRGVKNRGVWLNRRLPVNARIEFDAYSDSPDGDLKVEAWGDGQSGATGQSYSNATSYIFILGGWKNTRHVLARLDEHGEDRLEIDVDPNSDDERARPVEPGQGYKFVIERSDGQAVDWSVNGVSYFQLSDPDPLAGAGHEHLGFNDWDVPVCFDNLKITAL